MKTTEGRLRKIISKVLNERRMETEVYRIVMQNLGHSAPLSHQQLLAAVLHQYPNMSDDEIDLYIDSFEDTGAIKFDRRIQKYI